MNGIVRTLLLMLLAPLALAACATTPRATNGFTSEQVSVLRANGFVERGDGWELLLPDRLLFDHDSAELKPDIRAGIARTAASLLRVGITRARVEGHTDATGSIDYNQRLSYQRAASVASALQGSGYRAGDLILEGLGETVPIADNATEEGRAQNRRVAVIVTAR
jgi:outer membrane protein OmpA-like peptidoglycan-associated protein